MPTGTNDFNQPLATDPTSPGQGIAQTGNRLLMGGGSNSASGRWLWATGFENGLSEFSSSPSNAIDSNNLGQIYQGVYSGVLTTTAIVGNTQNYSKTLFAQGQRYGLEAMIRPQSPCEVWLLIVGPYKDRGNRSFLQFVLKIDTAGSSGIYTRVGATDTLVADVSDYFTPTSLYYHYFKAVGDPKNNAFIRVMLDDQTFELNNFPGLLVPGNDRPISFGLYIKTTTAAIKTMYVDNIVITADEP